VSPDRAPSGDRERCSGSAPRIEPSMMSVAGALRLHMLDAPLDADVDGLS